MVLHLSKKVYFCNFVLTSARNMILLQQITYMYLKGLVTHFQKMVLFIMLWLTITRYWGLKSKNFVKFLLSQHFFDILMSNFSWTVVQVPINHIIFWKSVMRNVRCIYVYCFNRFRFLPEISTKLQKMHFFGQFKDDSSGRRHGN